MFNIYIAWRFIFSYKLHTICFVENQRKKFGIKPHVYYPTNYIQITLKFVRQNSLIITLVSSANNVTDGFLLDNVHGFVDGKWLI